MPYESLGHIEAWAAAHGHSLTTTPLYAGAPLPSLDAVDCLVVMGGPMSVHDERQHPWLGAEKRCIAAALDGDRLVLGVCLGAQLVADVLGARVYRSAQREVGWWPIHPTNEGRASNLAGALPERLTVLHWHEDTFDLPGGAVLLAESDGCRQQAFACGERVLCLQFHLEMTPRDVRNVVENSADMLEPAPYVQSAEHILSAAENFAPMHAALDGILDRFASGVGPQRASGPASKSTDRL